MIRIVSRSGEWAARQLHLSNPTISIGRAYKELDRALAHPLVRV